MNLPNSTEHPIAFPIVETWRDNPRLSSGRSINNLIAKSVPATPQPQGK